MTWVKPGNGLASHRGGMPYGNSHSYLVLLKPGLSVMPLFVLFCLTETLPDKNVPSSHLTPFTLLSLTLPYTNLPYPTLPTLPYLTLPNQLYPTPPVSTQPYPTSAYLTCMFPFNQGGSQMWVCTYRRIPLGA